jgi:hypothetical protein
VNICSTNASIDNLSATDIEASGVIEAFSVEAIQMTATNNLATPFVNATAIDTESIDITRSTGGTAVLDIAGDKLDIDGGFLDAGNVTSKGITLRAGNSVVAAIEVGDDNGVTIRNLSSVNYETDNISCVVADITTCNTSQVNASNISTRNLSAVLQITSTFIDATNRMSAPVLNTQLNNVSIINASTINSQIGNFSSTNIINNNVSSVFVKRSTGGIATLDIHQDKLDIDGGFTSPLGAARGVTIRAGNNTVAAIQVEDDNGVTIRNLSSVNFETDNLTADNFNSTTSNISNLNVSILNASTKNAQTMNASTINCSTINSSFCNSFSMDTSIITSKIYQLEDASGLGGADGVISESSNELTIRTGASGGVTKFGTTTGGNFSVQIANDALNASTINSSQINATDIDATTIDADTITGDIGGNLAAGSGISLSTTAGVTTITNSGSVTDPLNLSKLNVSNVSGDNLSMGKASIATTIESAISKSTIFEVADSSGLGGQPDGYIYETANVMTIRTGAVGGVIQFGTTYAGNFSVEIANDALNASTANISTINSNTGNISSINTSVVNSDILNGNIANNLTAGTNITLSTTGGVTTINSTGGSVSDPLNLSTLNASTGNIGFINASVINSDFLNGSIANNLAAGTNITLSTSGGVTTINATGGGVTDPLNVSVVNLSTLNGLTSNISTNNASIFVTNNGYKMVGGATNNTAGGIGSAFGNSAAFGHVSKVLGTNTYAISQTSGGKTFVNCDPTQELGFYHGGSEKITITATEVDIRQDCNMSTSNTSTSNALVANMSQANASNLSAQNVSISSTLQTGVLKTQYQNASYAYFDDVQGLTNPGLIYKAADTFQFWSGTGTTKLVFTTDNTNLSVEVANNELNASVANISTLTATTITGDISPNLTAGTGITLSTTSGVTTINSTGLATSQQYYFSVTSTTGNFTPSNSAGTILQFGSLQFEEPSGNYNTGTFQYEIPVDGTYQFNYHLYYQQYDRNINIAFFVDGVRAGGLGGTTSSTSESGSILLELIEGQLVDLRTVYVASPAPVINLSVSSFSGYLLQPENNTITSSTALTTNSLTTSTTNVSNSNISNLTIDNNLNGYAFIRTVAIAKILGNGTNNKAVGCTVTRTAVGRYSCVLDVARADAQYVVQLTCMETQATLDDVIIQVTDGSMLSNVFTYFIHEQDNGGSPGNYRDRNHFVTVLDTD